MGPKLFYRPLSLLILFPCLFSIEVVAQRERERESLIGLEGIYVLAEDLTSDASRGGLSRNRIEDYAELRLRRNGIRVTSSRVPFLAVVVTLREARMAGGDLVGYVGGVDISVTQRVFLARNRNDVYAKTWSSFELFACSKEDLWRYVQEILDDIIDEFSNDYLAANTE